MRAPFAVLSAALLLLSTAIACNDDHSPTSPANLHDALTVSSISPPAGATVAAGGTIRCQVTLHWNLTSSTAAELYLLSWWDGKLIQTLASQDLQRLTSRSGETTQSILLAFPVESAGETRRLRFEIVPEGAGEPSATYEVSYTVERLESP